MSAPETSSPPIIAPKRLTSVDAYRGLVMFLMMAEVLRLSAVASAKPDSEVWKFLAFHQSHVEWIGCSLHDLIQPSFSFLVGVALPFSLAGRSSKGQSKRRMTLHAVWRALVLVFLGIFLRSLGRSRTNYTFEDTLTQIGLGYPFLFLIGLRPTRDHWIAFVLILVVTWGAFAAYPAPGSDFDFEGVSVSSEWRQEHELNGFAAHWNKNSNLAWAFDNWFMNLFPRDEPFTHNRGGYSTLNFIPTLATMILGLIAGGVLRSERPGRKKLGWMVGVGLGLLALGWGLGALGICPVVKRIWTPSWTLYSGGWCLLMLAGFFGVIEQLGWRGWAFPLVVIGMNSIAAYVMSWLFKGFITENLERHLGREVFGVLGPEYEPLLLGAAVLLVLWGILYWMYQRRLFLKI